MAGTRRRTASSSVVPLAVGSVALALDQLSKGVVTAKLGPGQPGHQWSIVEPVLRFQYVENRGAAFGLFRGAGDLLSILAIGVVITLVVYYLRMSAPSPALVVGVGLILGGAVGNVVDRIRLGYVIDFIAVGAGPKFNIADSAISIGVVLLAFGLTVVEPRSSQSRSPRSRSVPKSGAPMERD